jgi:hypothetical protein
MASRKALVGSQKALGVVFQKDEYQMVLDVHFALQWRKQHRDHRSQYPMESRSGIPSPREELLLGSLVRQIRSFLLMGTVEGSCVLLKLGQLHRWVVIQSTRKAWCRKQKGVAGLPLEYRFRIQFQDARCLMGKLRADQMVLGLKALVRKAQKDLKERIVRKHC